MGSWDRYAVHYTSKLLRLSKLTPVPRLSSCRSGSTALCGSQSKHGRREACKMLKISRTNTGINSRLTT